MPALAFAFSSFREERNALARAIDPLALDRARESRARDSGARASVNKSIDRAALMLRAPRRRE